MSESAGQNWLHHRDPRIKLLVLALVVIQIFAFRNPIVVALTGMEILIGIVLARIPLVHVAKRLRSIVWFAIVLIVTSALTQSGTAFFVWGDIIATWEGVVRGLYLTASILCLILASSVFVYTTPPDQILDALESAGIAGPRIMQSLTMILSMTLSFSPIMVTAAQQLKRAHQARGIEVDSGLIKRFRFVTAAAFPLFATSFRSAQHLALAIEGRCYEPGSRRTPFAFLKMVQADMVLSAITFLAFLAAMFLNFA